MSRLYDHEIVNGQPRVRVLALIEASSVTGPAKNLLQFAQRAGVARSAGISADISLVTFERDPGRTGEFVRAARDAGIALRVLRESRRFDLSPLRQLRSIVAEVQPDIIQSHNVKSHFFVRLMALHRTRPWLAFQHGYTATDWKDLAYNQFDRWSLRAAHRVICVCEPFALRLRRLGVAAGKIRIQHNSVRPFVAPDDLAISRLREELQSPRIILSVGRLSLEKGHADLLQAVSLLVRRGASPDVKLVLVGDGPEREPLAALAGKLGIGRNVFFAGHRQDVRPFYTIATLLTLPSHSEGSPNVVLEAMAAGVPVAATAVGGVPEILTDGMTGLVVPARDVACMAEAMRSLLDDPALRDRLARAAHARIQESFTPEAYSESVLKIYGDALATYTKGGHEPHQKR
jgi:glycosyltransferase involved in cell wall biosynthesis